MTTTLTGSGTTTCTQAIKPFFRGSTSISYGKLILPGLPGAYCNFGDISPNLQNIDTFIDSNIFMTSSTGPQTIISSASGDWALEIENLTNKFKIYVNCQDNSIAIVRSLLPVNVNQWYRVTVLLHYEFSQYVLHLYIDGNIQGDAALTAAPRFTGIPTLLVGGTGGTSAQIQDIQIIQGQNMSHSTPLVVPTGSTILSLNSQYLTPISLE